MDSQENVADQYDVSAKLISHLVVLSLEYLYGSFSNWSYEFFSCGQNMFWLGFFCQVKNTKL